jgi:hypothetical protein
MEGNILIPFLSRARTLLTSTTPQPERKKRLDCRRMFPNVSLTGEGSSCAKGVKGRYVSFFMVSPLSAS